MTERPVSTGVAETLTMVTLRLAVRPPNEAVTLAYWLLVTVLAVRTPPEMVAGPVTVQVALAVTSLLVPLS